LFKLNAVIKRQTLNTHTVGAKNVSMFKLNAVIKRQTLNTHTVGAKNVSTNNAMFLLIVNRKSRQHCKLLFV